MRKNKQIADEILSTIRREEIFSLKHRISLKNSSVFAMSFPFREGALIAVYNPMCIRSSKTDPPGSLKIDPVPV
jgi:hypothetical protein